MEVLVVINIAPCLCNSGMEQTMKNLFKTGNKKVNSNMLRQWKVIITRIFNIEYKRQEKSKLKVRTRKSSEI